MSAVPLEGPVREPFAEPAQQREAAFLGMYIFLATEVMLFGAILGAVLIYRNLHPEAARAVSRELSLWLATANTAVLLVSSLLAALAVAAARAGTSRAASGFLAATAALGLAFLAIKAIEYGVDDREGLMPLTANAKVLSDPAEHLFVDLYYVATGLHSVHLAVGISLVLVLAWRVRRGSLPLPGRAIVIEMAALYWHLVDVVWVFLYPVLYLGR